MMRRCTALHRAGEYDAEIDEAMRGLVQTLARVPGDRYPLAANETRSRRSTRCSARSIGSRTGSTRTGKPRCKRPPDNVAEAERRRDLALRGVVAHIATVDDRTHALAGDEAISWVERGDGEAATRSTRRRSTWPTILRTRSSRARRASCSPARRSPPDVVRVSARALGVDDAQEYVAPSPFDYARRRGSTSRRRTAIRRRDFARARRADRRRVLDARAAARSCSSRRTRGCARCTRSCASGSSFPDEDAGRDAARASARLVPLARERGALRDGHVLGRHRRRRRSALVRDHRPAAVSVARRSARRGALRRSRRGRSSSKST
jgi:hypothetical protein